MSKIMTERANGERVQSSSFNRKHKSHLTRRLAVNSQPKSFYIDVTIFNDAIL